MVKKWTEDTGIEFEWTEIPSESATEKINLQLVSGADLPDVFWTFGDGKSGNTVVQYADQDIFLPTENIIDEYMPNLKKILDDNPQYRQEITAPNGHTYGFPYIEEMKGLVLTPGPLIINKTWLDELGLEVPTTVDEWVECLKAFRDGGDLNGNGEDRRNSDGHLVRRRRYLRFLQYGSTASQERSAVQTLTAAGNEYADHLRLIDGQVTLPLWTKRSAKQQNSSTCFTKRA